MQCVCVVFAFLLLNVLCFSNSLDAKETNVYDEETEEVRRKEEPKPSISIDGTVYLGLNRRLNLTCNATGTMEAPHSIDWFHNGLLVHNLPYSRRQIMKEHEPQGGRSLISRLIKERVRQEDEGTYVCRSMHFSNVQLTSVVVHIFNESEKSQSTEKRVTLTDTQSADGNGDDQNTNKGPASRGCTFIIVIAWMALFDLYEYY